MSRRLDGDDKSSGVRVIDEHDVRRLLPMGECIEVMAEALASLARGEVHNPLRFVVRPPDAASLMGLMPAYRGGEAPLWGLKSVVIAPANAARGLDLHQGFVALFDGLDRLREEADAKGVDLPTLAFAWVLARVDGAVCGPNRAEQLDPILAARELQLSADDVDRIGGFFL